MRAALTLGSLIVTALTVWLLLILVDSPTYTTRPASAVPTSSIVTTDVTSTSTRPSTSLGRTSGSTSAVNGVQLANVAIERTAGTRQRQTVHVPAETITHTSSTRPVARTVTSTQRPPTTPPVIKTTDTSGNDGNQPTDTSSPGTTEETPTTTG